MEWQLKNSRDIQFEYIIALEQKNIIFNFKYVSVTKLEMQTVSCLKQINETWWFVMIYLLDTGTGSADWLFTLGWAQNPMPEMLIQIKPPTMDDV